MSTNRDISDAIYAVFTPLVGRENIHIKYQNGRPTDIVIYSPSLPTKCIFLELYIYPKENSIYIHGLHNCEQKRMGLQLLNLVEDLAKRIGSNEITLIDMSKLVMGIGSSISLNTLYNLTTGQSWYNKLGYICRDPDFPDYHVVQFEENKNKITTMSVREFVSEEVEPMVGEPMGGLLEEIKIEFPEFDLDPDKTIQEYFTFVKSILQQYSEGTFGKNKNVSLLWKLIKLIDDTKNITTYPTSDCLLIKEMKTAGGRNRKKNRSVRRNNPSPRLRKIRKIRKRKTRKHRK